VKLNCAKQGHNTLTETNALVAPHGEEIVARAWAEYVSTWHCAWAGPLEEEEDRWQIE
jgi:hypothetical protein